jgi:hypothetical protein
MRSAQIQSGMRPSSVGPATPAIARVPRATAGSPRLRRSAPARHIKAAYYSSRPTHRLSADAVWLPTLRAVTPPAKKQARRRAIAPLQRCSACGVTLTQLPCRASSAQALRKHGIATAPDRRSAPQRLVWPTTPCGTSTPYRPSRVQPRPCSTTLKTTPSAAIPSLSPSPALAVTARNTRRHCCVLPSSSSSDSRLRPTRPPASATGGTRGHGEYAITTRRDARPPLQQP